MFVQVIQGQVADAEQVHAALDQWVKELAPNATGWLGTTAGVTDEGRFIALARFESADAARQNSEQPAQDQWWKDFSANLEGEATFHESDDVVVDLVGEPDAAGFVQVMQGRGTDPDRARELMSQDSDAWAGFRPELLGSEASMYGDGEFTMAMYFTSEADAREGEQKEPPPELKAQMDELNSMAIGMPTFFDLRRPWLYSPR